MKLGTYVKVEETGQVGIIHKLKGDLIEEILLPTGEVIQVIDKTITILGIIRTVWEYLKMIYDTLKKPTL